MIRITNQNTYEYRLYSTEMAGETVDGYPLDKIAPTITVVTFQADSWAEVLDHISNALDDALYAKDAGRAWSYGRMLIDHIRGFREESDGN